MTIAARYHIEMDSLRGNLLRMGGIVEEMLGLVVEALRQHDEGLARQCCEMDHQVDRLEKDIDEHCLRILALHQPAAEELRFVAMSMKLVTDLERMGDLVTNIGERVISLSEGERPRVTIDIQQLATLVRDMVRQALDSFVMGNVDLAQKVMRADERVDELHWQFRRELVKQISEASESAHRGIELILLVKHLERLGDHATNIAEEVIFLVHGRDVRHAYIEEHDG